MEDTLRDQTAGSEKNVLGELWTKYIAYWPVFLLLLALCIGGAWWYLKRTAPLYEATATLLIKDERKGIDDSKMIESLNLISTKKIVENEIEVLKSRALMNEVVANLHLYAPVYEDNKWRDVAAYSTSPIHVEAKHPDSLAEVRKISFTLVPAKDSILVEGKAYPMNRWVSTDFGDLKFVPNNRGKLMQKEGPFHFALLSPKRVTLGLMSSLEAAASSKLSTVIDLNLKNEDPALAEGILNELLRAYNRAAINDRNALSANTLGFVQERLDVVGGQLDSTERRIQQYKANQGAVDIGAQGKLFLQNVSENDQKVGNVNMQLAVLSQVEKYLKEKDNRGGIVPSTLGISDPLLSDLLDKLYDAEVQKEKMKKTVGENSFEMQSLTDQIDKIKPSVLENIQNQRRNLEASRTDLVSTNSAYTSLLQSIPQKERDLVEISRQQNIQSNIYAFLLQKREEAALSNSSNVGDNRVVDRAESSLVPVSPKNKLVYAISIFVALVIGVGLVTAKELFTRTILYRSEIENLTRVPIIGEIGYDKTGESVVIRSGTQGLLPEQFRRLRSSLGYIGLGGQKKKILVTSSVPGEGKSFIVANLGMTLALAGKKVIVVEADLTHPTLSDKLEVVAVDGLSAYLAGEVEPEEIIKRTTFSENLFVLPAGTIPPNPSELILKGRMSELLTYLGNIFDYVIVDTAPVGALSDAYNISPLCDGTLYVVRHGRTPKVAVEKLDKNNRINVLNNAAIIFNAVRLRGFSKESYGDGYGYGYTYNRKGDVKTREKKKSNA